MKYIIFLILLCIFYGCSQKTRLNVVEAQQIFVSTNELVDTKKQPFSSVNAIGTFMNVKNRGEHASGYLVRLWKQDEKILGLISVYRGIIGDPPMGLLENVQFDPQTKKISFRSKLTTGLFYDKNNSDIPSQDVFEFQGILKDKKLIGELTITNNLCSDKCLEQKKISLSRSREWSEGMEEYKNFEEWKSFAEEMLNRSRPKW